MTTMDADGVISGLDAVAATPEAGLIKPTVVAVGQRWRRREADPYTVTRVEDDAAWVRGDSGWNGGPWLCSQVLADTPVLTPPTCKTWCNTAHVAGAPCRFVPAGPAAPAPGVGEGAVLERLRARIVEDMKHAPRHDWDKGYLGGLSAVLSWLVACGAEPLPAPAPRVSRVAEIVDEWCDQTAPEPMGLARDVVRAVMLEVNCRVEHGASPTQVAAVEELFVGPDACPGRRP